MVGLLVLTFGFFGLHTLLWLNRLVWEFVLRKKGDGGGGGDSKS
jgi:hypothetical protein